MLLVSLFLSMTISLRAACKATVKYVVKPCPTYLMSCTFSSVPWTRQDQLITRDLNVKEGKNKYKINFYPGNYHHTDRPANMK